MNHISALLTTSVLTLLLTACGGGSTSVGIGTGGGSGGGGGTTQPAAPAGVYMGGTTDRQYLVATVPSGSSNQTIWWYSHSQSDQVNVGVLDGFLIGSLTASGSSTNGSFTVSALTNFDLSTATTPATTLTGNTYANGDIMGTLNEGADVSYQFSSVNVPAVSLTDLATDSPYSGSVLDRAGTTTDNINIQVQSDGRFAASAAAPSCSDGGVLTPTSVNGVFFVTTSPMGGTSCFGGASTGIALKYSGSFYVAVANAAGTTAALFRGN